MFGSVSPNTQLHSTHRLHTVRAGPIFWSSGWRSLHGICSEQLSWPQTCRTPKVPPSLASISYKDWRTWPGAAPDWKPRGCRTHTRGGQAAPTDPRQRASLAPTDRAPRSPPAPQGLVSTRPARSGRRAEPHHPTRPAPPQRPKHRSQPPSSPAAMGRRRQRLARRRSQPLQGHRPPWGWGFRFHTIQLSFLTPSRSREQRALPPSACPWGPRSPRCPPTSLQLSGHQPPATFLVLKEKHRWGLQEQTQHPAFGTIQARAGLETDFLDKKQWRNQLCLQPHQGKAFYWRKATSCQDNGKFKLLQPPL